MKSCNINGVQISRSEDVSLDEALEYLKHIQAKFNKAVVEITIESDGEFVDVGYKFVGIPFERIRRITGYLTGTTDTWNPSKTAELKDRVTHSGVERLGEI